MSEDVFKGLGVEINLINPENFLKIKETLTRIGVASRRDNKLFQSCHILHKKERYAIVHFKEMFILDGNEDTVPEEDISRRNIIANLLEEWNLCEIIHDENVIEEGLDLSRIKIIPFRDKDNWTLIPKYTIGM